MYTDTIADLLTRIRNALRARKDSVSVPYSKSKAAILENLKKKHFINGFEVTKDGVHSNLEIELNTDRADLELNRVSKPGQRIYIKSTEIKKIHGGLGVQIISTSKGMMTGEEAKKMQLGGELICEIY
ncbi:MAG: 30S ribosomal protein S8 [Candidatus Altimarinota bacterium]